MAQYVSFEGTQDYLVHLPALIMTFEASGSISAGNAVGMNPSNGTVYALSGPTSTALTAAKTMDFMGVATKTVATTKKVPVIVWGAVKNVVAQTTITAGQYLIPSGSGAFAPATYAAGGQNGYSLYVSDETYSGSIAIGRALTAGTAAGTFRALIRGF